MRSRKRLTWGGSLVAGGISLLVLGSLSQVQATDLCIPPVCSFSFVMLRIPAAGAAPIGDGTLFAGLTFPNGGSSGAYFQDQTVHNRELVIYGSDGVTPATAVWQFFNPSPNPPVQYNYNYQTGVCTESSLSVTETEICPARNATLVAASLGQIGFWDLYVATPAPGQSVEAGMEANSLSKPGFLVWRNGPNTTDMRIINFSTRPIPSTQWTLPANCGS